MSEIGYEAKEEQRRPTHGRRRAHGSGGPSGPGGSKRNLLIIGGAGVAVLLVVVVVAVMVLGGGGSKKAQTDAKAARIAPRVYVNTPDNPQMKKLNNRADDKRPLTKDEIFDDQAKTVNHGAYTFTLAASSLSDCKSATWGGQFQGDLVKYGCTQIARGAYVSRDKRYLGQFIVLNLNDLQGSEQIVRDLDPDANAGGVSPLEAPGSINFTGGFSAAYSQAFGHFVVVSWVERAGGAQPQTMNELLDASIAIERADDFVWERLILAGG